MLKPAYKLQILSFTDMFCVGLIVPQLQNHALALGCSHLIFGLMGAMYSVSQMVAEPLIGTISDIKGRKPILVLILALCSIGYTLLGLTTSIVFFIFLRTTLGFFKQTQLLVKTLGPDYESNRDKQAVIFGRLATLSSLGMAVGPMVAGHIVQAYPENGFTIITCIVGAIYALNTGFINSLPNKNSKKQKNYVIQRKGNASNILFNLKSSFKESIHEFYKVPWSIYWDVFLLKLLMTFCVGTFFSNYGIYLQVKHNVSPIHRGYIIAFLGGIGALCTYFISYVSTLYKNDKDFTNRTLHVFVVLTISVIGMGVAPNIRWYLLFVVPFSLSLSVGRVASLEMIMNKGHTEHRGSVIGIMGSMRSLSGVVTPILGGLISEYIGVTYVIYFGALFSATGIVVSYIIKTQSLVNKSKKD